MGSSTDLIVEGLKYPFNDVRKYLSLGVLQLVVYALVIGGFLLIANFTTGFSDATVNATANISAASSSLAIISLILFILAIIVSIIILGYQYRVLSYSIDSNNELPDFKNPLNLFVNGLKIIVVEIIYNILPFILVLLGFMLAVNVNVGGSVNAVGYVILIIALIFGIVVYFLQLMAIMHMVDSGNLRSAFEFKEIFSLISEIGVLRYVGIIIFAAIVMGVISLGIFAILQIIGIGIALFIPFVLVSLILVMVIEGLFIVPYFNIATYRIYGSIYNEASTGASGSGELAFGESEFIPKPKDSKSKDIKEVEEELVSKFDDVEEVEEELVFKSDDVEEVEEELVSKSDDEEGTESKESKED